MNIAKTILDQIKATTPQPVLWSWGASAYRSVNENQIKLDHDYLGALLFYVRGYKHKGQVIISLALNDTYTVSIGHLKKGEMNVKKQIKEVYFDELGSTIDELIEKQENYAF